MSPRLLVRLFRLEGWRERPCPHGILFTTGSGPSNRSATVPLKRDPIPRGTLGAILGPKQTGWGRTGLDALLAKHGLGRGRRAQARRRRGSRRNPGR